MSYQHERIQDTLNAPETWLTATYSGMPRVRLSTEQAMRLVSLMRTYHDIAVGGKTQRMRDQGQAAMDALTDTLRILGWAIVNNGNDDAGPWLDIRPF